MKLSKWIASQVAQRRRELKYREMSLASKPKAHGRAIKTRGMVQAPGRPRS